MGLGRCGALVILAAAMLGSMGNLGHAAKDSQAATSGLPIPRYVSLKSDHVNVRAGPTKDNDVAWVYTRTGLPVEITAEFENWRRVRDSEGAEGWVYHSLLSGRRTAVVTMKSKEDLAAIELELRATCRAQRQPFIVRSVFCGNRPAAELRRASRQRFAGGHPRAAVGRAVGACPPTRW
mgnify:CR=1 FL=1